MPANGKRKWIKWVVILLLLGGAGGGGYWYWAKRSREVTQYQTTPVARGDMTQTVTATGQLNPVTNVTVGCQISGTIKKILIDYNSPVTNGQIVAQIEPFIYDANVQLATADLANAEAAMELSQINARRAEELYKSKLIPQSDFDTALANLHQTQAVVQSKKASLSRTKVDLDHCTIYSPVDGTVISRSVDVGQTVAASLSAPTLFTIANDLTKMQIDSNVAEADIGGIAVGQLVDFTVDAFPTRTFHGRVMQVRNAPITVQNVVTYDTVIEVNNSDLKLKPGMTANVSIIIAQREGVLKVPNAALRFRPQEAATNTVAQAAGGMGGRPGGAGGRGKGERKTTRTVYVLKDNKPQPVQVKTGITDGMMTEILEGLEENDPAITGAIYKQTSSSANNPFSGGRRF